MWVVGKDLQEVPLQGAGEELTSKAQALPALLITCIFMPDYLDTYTPFFTSTKQA